MDGAGGEYRNRNVVEMEATVNQRSRDFVTGTQDIFLTMSRDNKQGQEGDGKERLNGTLHFSIPFSSMIMNIRNTTSLPRQLSAAHRPVLLSSVIGGGPVGRSLSGPAACPYGKK